MLLLVGAPRRVSRGPILLLLGLLISPRVIRAKPVIIALLRARLHADLVQRDRARLLQDRLACHAKLVTSQAQRARHFVPRVIQTKAPSHWRAIALPAFQGGINGPIQEYMMKT